MTLTNISPFIEVTHQLLNTHYREDKIYKKTNKIMLLKQYYYILGILKFNLGPGWAKSYHSLLKRKLKEFDPKT